MLNNTYIDVYTKLFTAFISVATVNTNVTHYFKY